MGTRLLSSAHQSEVYSGEDKMNCLLVTIVAYVFSGLAYAGMPVLPAIPQGIEGDKSDAAVVVGVENYPQMPDVPFASADAKAFYDWLRTSETADPANIHLLQDFAPSKEAILSALRDAKEAVRPGGRLWFYFAGHGIAHPNTGERLFVGWDAGPDTFAERSVSFDEIKSAAQGTPLTVVADACFGGKGRGGVDITGGKRFMVPVEDLDTASDGEVESWFSVTDSEFSSPLEGAQHGAFTYFLVGGLSGWADKNRDKKVDTTELHEFVKMSLRTVQIRDQTPTFSGGKRTVIAGLSVAAPLFDPTAAKSKSNRPSGMSGAIQELKNRLAAASPGSKEQLFIESKLLKKQASNEWVELAGIAAAAGPKALGAISKFINTYEGTMVGAGSNRLPVTIPELTIAKATLESIRQAAPTGPDDGVDPRTRAVAMSKDHEWAASIRRKSPGVLFPGNGFGEFSVGVIDSLLTISSGSCIASGAKLKPRDCSKVKDSKIELVDKVEIQNRVGDHNVVLLLGLFGGQIHRITLSGFGATPEGAVIGKSTPDDVIALYGEPTGAKRSRIGVKLMWKELGLETQFQNARLYTLIVKAPQ